MAINMDSTKTDYIKNAIYVNIIIVLMWICMYGYVIKQIWK